MKPARVLPLFWFAARLLAAGGPPEADDPFAAYHQAFARRLAEMLEPQAAAASEPAPAAPAGEAATPGQDPDAELKAFAARYWGGREAEFAAALGRLQSLRPALEPILAAEGVPKQLAAVVLIESGARPFAASPRQARGLWQFIPETARRYGLTVGAGDDERVQLESATRAAARYLRDLYRRFGDWPLALAAYNAGQRRVEAALEKGGAGTFWQLSSAGLLPMETRSYVPAVLAAMSLLRPAAPAVAGNGTARGERWVYAPASASN